MAAANVELSGIAYKGQPGFSLYGRCLRSESLTVSGSTATLGTAVGATEGIDVFRITTDTACYFAVGSTPDPTATAKTDLTGARRYLAANAEFTGQIQAGEKVAVHT